jgi:hypothetical protein
LSEEERKKREDRKQVPLRVFEPPPEAPLPEEDPYLAIASKRKEPNPHLFNEVNSNINYASHSTVTRLENMCTRVQIWEVTREEPTENTSTLNRSPALEPSYLHLASFLYFALRVLNTRFTSKLVTYGVLCSLTSKLCFRGGGTP